MPVSLNNTKVRVARLIDTNEQQCYNCIRLHNLLYFGVKGNRADAQCFFYIYRK